MTLDKEPKIWGPHAWTFIFTSMFSYEESRRSEYTVFLKSLGMILPCSACRDHFASFLLTNPITSTTNLMNWVVKLYNANTSTPKTEAEIINYFTELFGDIQISKNKVRFIKVNKKSMKIKIVNKTLSTPLTVARISQSTHTPVIQRTAPANPSNTIRRGCGCGRR